jgi:hypothetical protein
MIIMAIRQLLLNTTSPANMLSLQTRQTTRQLRSYQGQLWDNNDDYDMAKSNYYEDTVENSILRAKNIHLHNQLKAMCTANDNYHLLCVEFVIIMSVLMFGFGCRCSA